MTEYNSDSQHRTDAFAALLDNEPLADSEIDQLSESVSRDRALRQQLARHQLISCGLKGERINLKALNLVDTVSDRLANEPTVLAPTRWRNSHRWIQPLVGTAVAASVAALGIAFAPQLLNQDPTVPGAGIQVVAQPVSTPPVVQVAQQQEQTWKTLETKPRKELTPYLKDHSEYAVQGVMPYASYVSYDEHKH